ncbi:DNA-binding protein [Halorientalis sp. IM1011]|uniref:helix-turn-helix domain-containing protein n=1 Tax=Halorientalis sp. IM1011 TaxID=1932360 RepID=UPI00097CCF13|nr:helix-turn-helix domain-containing protein [Halorientalis sp. IM1011]AQL44340.1 DNA-binding protein [Halorientalis sp. IM1011]
MSSGIRATVEFSTPDICPIVEHATEAGATVDSVATSVRPSADAESTTEFSIDEELEPESDLTTVFSHGSTRRYRLVHDDEVSCPCACLGQFGCPVTRYVAREGHLTVVFHAADYEELQAVVGELRQQFPGVDIKRFVRAPAGETGRDSVLVDRSKLTDRQLEVLETAHEMGYFENPRRANATEIADELDINPSTFREHLSAAETKLLGDLL